MSEPLTTERIETLERLEREATPGPWVAEKSMRDDCSVHFAIRTAEPLPEHPHSPRFVAWMCGLLREYLPPSQRDRWRYCKECERGYWMGRSVPVEVRDDPQVEADAMLYVTLRNALPSLLASARAHAAALARAEAAEAERDEALSNRIPDDAPGGQRRSNGAPWTATQCANYWGARAVAAERDLAAARASSASLRERVEALAGEYGTHAEALSNQANDAPYSVALAFRSQAEWHRGVANRLRALLAPTKETDRG